MTLEPAIPAVTPGSLSAPGAFAAAAPESMVTVKMTNGAWAPTEAVQIHWNGLAGPLLATAQGGKFSTPVQVPQVAPGVYYVTATDPAGTKRISQAIEVTGPANATALAPAAIAYPAAQHASSSNLMLGAEILGGGLVALFSAVAITTFTRRRSSATRSR